MIKYNNSNINDWYFDTSNIIKVYRNNAVCYYKISGTPPAPTAQTPCFAVVDNISQYSDTEFEDVYDKATEKWYKLNNLNQYEEYGVYGSGRTICSGETPTSRLPQGYTEVEYVENTGTSYFNTNFTPNQNTRVVMQYQMVTDSGAGRMWGAGAWNSASGIEPNYENGYLQISWFGNTSWTRYNNFPADYNKHLLDLNKNYLYIDETLVGSNTYTTKTASDPIGVFTYIASGRPSSSTYWGIEHFKGKMFSFQIYDNDTLVRDLVPCVRDNDNEVGAYDIVNDVFYAVPTGYTTDKLVAGSAVTEPCVTAYEGKLTIDGDYEYIYSGGSWINVGEISGGTIQTVWFDPPSSGDNANFNIGHYWGENYKMIWTMYLQGSYSNDTGSFWRTDNKSPIELNFYSNGYYYDMHNPTSTSSPSVYTGDYSYRLMRTSVFRNYENSQVMDVTLTYGSLKAELVDSGTVIENTGSTRTGFSWYNGLYEPSIFLQSTQKCHLSRIQVYNASNVLVNDITFVKNDGVTGSQEISMYDSVLNVTYNNTNSNTPTYHIVEEGGGGYEYPLEYVVREDPPDNLVFTSMEEADEYECPWVGMKATIDGSGYTFSGDSISGYEWVYTPKTLPTGYTAVEYIQNASTAYINTNYYPNQDTRIVAEMQVVSFNSFGRLLGAGNHNTANTISCDYIDSGSTFEVSWGGYTGWTQYSVTSNYDKHTYDWNKNSFYIDGTLLDTKTFKSFTCSYKLGIFNVLESGDVPTSNTGRYFYGKLYSFKIYDNDTLVRDFVPCKRDSDSKYGLYDVVNDVFYISPNNTNFSGGSPV